MNRCLFDWHWPPAVGLAMIRILTGVNIYWILIPGYTLALIMRKTDPIFVSVPLTPAVSGPAAQRHPFLLPMTPSAHVPSVGGEGRTTDAFGVVALVYNRLLLHPATRPAVRL